MKAQDQLAEVRGDLLRAQRASGLTLRTRAVTEAVMPRHHLWKLHERAIEAGQARLGDSSDGLESAREILTIASEGLSRCQDKSLRAEWQALVDEAQAELARRMRRHGSEVSVPANWKVPT